MQTHFGKLRQRSFLPRIVSLCGNYASVSLHPPMSPYKQEYPFLVFLHRVPGTEVGKYQKTHFRLRFQVWLEIHKCFLVYSKLGFC